MNLDELRSGPTHGVRVFRTGRCRILGPYASHSYARDRDHEFTLYVSVIQGNGITALVDVGMASVAQMYQNVELDDPVAICQDAVQCRAALALARTDVDVLLPGHDPEILSRFPGGRVA